MAELSLREPDDDLLPLLRKCSSEDLEPLVSYITNKGGLTSELELTKAYKKHYPNHKMYVDEIAAEIQKYGGNTIINIARGGKGVPYREIVCDVAKKLKVNFNKKRETEFIEQQIALKLLERAWEKMTDEEKRVFMDELGLEHKSKSHIVDFPIMALQALVKLGGFAPYKISLILANATAKAIMGRGLSLATNAAIARYLSVFAGPIGWAVTTIWTIFDLASPAYRVIVPCVAHIAMLRQKYALLDKGADLTEDLKISKPKKRKSSVHANHKKASLPSAV